MRAMIFTVGVFLGTVLGAWLCGGYIADHVHTGKPIGDDRGGQYKCERIR